MEKSPRKLTRVIVTVALVLIAIIAVYIVYYRSSTRPWTRDGQVRADIIAISSQVNGLVVKVAVKDNELVKKSDLLFQIYTEDYEMKVKESEVALDQAHQEVKALIAQVKASAAHVEQGKAQLKLAQTERDRILKALETNAVSHAYADQAIASVDNAKAQLDASIADLEESRAKLGVSGEDNVRIRSAKVDLQYTKLRLSWTSIYAPSDGYVTNLNLKVGDYAEAGSAVLTFVNNNSYYTFGYFKETQLKNIKPGQRAVVTLMGYPDQPIEGVVNSIGRAISTPDTADIGELVPEISATFDWVRLAQRIPVKIILKKIPEGVDLVSGMTASVAVYTEE
ncbi:MAG: HlyD family secretion protein [Deltaproteobacteria bacterium]|nr:HlyD family secretion protein [Deltaproteobacteria bacterium]